MPIMETLREKWEDFNYWLEDHNIPKPLFFALVVIVILALLYFSGIFTIIAPPAKPVTLKVMVVDKENNPISNAKVTLYSEAFDTKERTTNQRGQATFTVPANTKFVLEVSYEDQIEERELTLEEDSTETVMLDMRLITYYNKRIIFYKGNTQEKATDIEELDAYCTLTEWEKYSVPVKNGEALLENIPSDCGSLIVNVGDKQFPTTVQDSAPFEIRLEEAVQKGTIIAMIADATTNQPVGAREISAILLNEFSQQVAGPLESDSTGTVVFEDIEPGKYRVKVLGLGKYKDIISEEKELLPGKQTLFTIKVERSAAFPIKIRVLDVQGLAVKSVKLELKDSEDNTLVQSVWTNVNGEYTFYVDEETTYWVVLTKGNWTKTLEVTPSEEFYEVTYNPEELKESGQVIVKVTDQDGELLENVNVELFTSEQKATGYACVTGADGQCEFDEVMPGIYYAKASLGNFPPVASANFEMKPYSAQPVEINLSIEIGKGAFEFTVLNESSKPIQKAKVKAVDISTGKTIASSETDSEGIAELLVRVDRKPFFVVEADGYLPYVTIPLTPIYGITIEKKVMLVKGATSLKIEFEGLSVEDESVTDFVSAGKIYTAKLKVIVPDAKYKKVGMHLRIGREQANKTSIMEEDIAYISEVYSNAQKIIKGTTFTPPQGTNVDMVHLTDGSAKWANLEWILGNDGMPNKGVFEAEFDVAVRDSAVEGETFKLSYRAYGDKGVYVRDPEDKQLGQAKTSAEKQELYALTYDVFYSIGITNLCDSYYCKSFTIEDLSNKTKLVVTDSYPAKIGNHYRLHFTINKKGFGYEKGATLKMSAQQALQFGAYEIEDAEGKRHEGLADKELELDIGSISQNKTIAGFVEFETIKEGTAILNISIVTEQGVSFEHEIAIEIEAGNELELDIVPKTIVPLIDNELLFRFTEKDTNEPVENVAVSLYLDGTRIASGVTDSDGVFPYVLQAPNAGATLKVVGKKPGYKPLTHELKIDEKILKVMPPTVNIDLQAVSREEAEFSITVDNQTAIPFTISEISFGEGLSDLIEVEAVEEYKGKEVAPGSTFEVKLKAKLTEKGKAVEETKSLESEITINVENKDLQKVWSDSITLNARILLGAELDYEDCLVIEPTSWDIKTFGRAKQISFTIRNTCTANGEAASLRALKARVRWHGESPIGTFKIRGDFIKDGELELSESREIVAENIIENFEEEATLIFTPNEDLQSASVNPDIEFEAVHLSDSGKETIKAKIDVSIIANKLLNCLRIIRDTKIELRTCGFDTGWGLSSRYFDRDPYATGLQPSQPPQQQYPYTWPTAQYVPPWQTKYSYGAYNQRWKCEEDEAELTVENACTEAVEITVKTDSALSADPTTLEIDPVSSKTITIAPSTRIGRFKVKILGKFKGVAELADEIDSFTVKVLRFQDISEQCLPTIEPTILRANFLGWQKSAGRIYNKCYHLGYKLIQPTRENFHCYTPESQGTSLEGPCPLIRQVVFSLPKVEEISETEAWEIMEFSIWYNPKIIEQMPLVQEGTIEQRIGNLRIVASNVYNAVVSPGIISVPMNIPDVGTKYFPVEVTFEDPFQWLGVAGMLIDEGNPNLFPAECVNIDALNLPFNGVEVLSDDDFINNRFVWNENPPQELWVMPVARSNEDVTMQSAETIGFCGRADYINPLPFTTWEDPASGVKLYFELTKGKHHIVMTVDRSEMFTKCAKIEFQMPIKVTRVFHNAGTQEVKLNVVVNVLNKGVKEFTEGCENEPVKTPAIPDWASIEACENTGASVYYQYGFDRLLFKWHPEDIDALTCDSAEGAAYFCDGAQFIMQLSHRFREINDRIEKLNKEVKDNVELRTIIQTIGENDVLVEELQNETGKLYKITKKQTIVHDSVTGNKLLFFLGQEGIKAGFLVPAKSDTCDTSGLTNSINELLNSLNASNEAYSANTLANALPSLERALQSCYGPEVAPDNIVGILPETTDMFMSGNAASIWTNMKEVIEWNPELQSYVISYNEYKTLHDQLLAGVLQNIATQSREAPITITMGNTTVSATEAEWSEFLRVIVNNVQFRVGLMNVPGLAPDVEEYIRTNAIDVVEPVESTATTELSYANLKVDNLSANLVADVLNTYNPAELNPDQIEFEQYLEYDNGEFKRETTTKLAAGEYAYRIEPKIVIDFEGGLAVALEKFVVKLVLAKPIEQIDAEQGTSYAENPLFYVSLDGPIGRGKKNVDYGIGFSLPENLDVYYYYNSYDDWEKAYERAPGIKTLTVKYSDKYENTRTGRVLALDLRKGSFEYFPSYPVALKLSSQYTNNIIYYRFNNEYYYGNIKNVFVWWPSSETEMPRVDELASFPPESYCEGWSDTMNLARIMLSPGDWYSIAYMPYTPTSETGAQELQLEIFCAKDPVVLSAKIFEGETQSTAETRSPAGGSVRIVEARGAPATIEEYLSRINDGEICINKINRTQLILKWNPGVIELPG